MSSYLVTGVARGLGLEIVRILSTQPADEVSRVFGTIRSSPPPALQEIVDKSDGRLIIVELEVTNLDSIDAAVDEVKKHVGNQGLDILINNAAINKDFPDGILTMDNLREMFEVNVEAVHNLTKAFVPLLREGRCKTVLNMSSITASLAHAKRFMIAPHYSYRISKAALNSMTKMYALSLENEGFTFVAVSPGWAKTDQGGSYADLEASESAQGTLDVLKKGREALNGKFLNILVPGWENTTGLHKYDGLELEW
ncbi:hypothetical protein FGRMN_6523 [Fusarium graminum]|nr:hypothetical protein FGRMN_6523 [Fusarium graminum]